MLGCTPLGTTLFHSTFKCLHNVQQVVCFFTSSDLCMRFSHSKTECIHSPCIELQNRNGSTHKNAAYFFWYLMTILITFGQDLDCLVHTTNQEVVSHSCPLVCTAIAINDLLCLEHFSLFHSLARQPFRFRFGGKGTSGHFRQVLVGTADMLAEPIRLHSGQL